VLFSFPGESDMHETTVVNQINYVASSSHLTQRIWSTWFPFW
jgi:hypothetical protein